MGNGFGVSAIKRYALYLDFNARGLDNIPILTVVTLS